MPKARTREIQNGDMVVLQIYVPHQTGRALHLAAGAVGDPDSRYVRKLIEGHLIGAGWLNHPLAAEIAEHRRELASA